MNDSINRRQALGKLGIAGATLAATLTHTEDASANEAGSLDEPPTKKTMPKHDMSGYAIPSGPPQQIAMLIYPGMTALDMVGPNQFLAGLGNVQVHLVAKTHAVVATDTKMRLLPDMTYAECPHNLTVLFAPGGLHGTLALMNDEPTLRFLAERGTTARYVTSVCTGSLLLGAAGLLNGYKATTHWSVHDVLADLGAIPVKERVVEDRNRITGAGVTSGIDFALRLTERLRNEKMARALQLGMEYDPKPPYHAGTVAGAGADVAQMMEAMYAPLNAQAHEAAKLAKARLQKRA